MGDTPTTIASLSDAEKILRGFKYIKPSGEGVANIITIRSGCYQLCELILATVPPGRERALAITKLEEVCMWANKALVLSQSDNSTSS